MSIFSKTPTSTQTGARLAELQALHQTAAERADAARGEYAALVEQVVAGEVDRGAADKAKAKYKYAADQAEVLGDSVAAAQRRHDAAQETEERARRVELWRRVVEISGRRTAVAEAFQREAAALAKRRDELRDATAQLADLIPLPLTANHDPAKLLRAPFEDAVMLELKRCGLTATIKDPSGYALPELADTFRGIDQWILSKRDEALRGG